jgi:hypothetical protein
MNAFDALVGWKLKAALTALVLAILAGFMVWGQHAAVQGERKRMAPVIAGYELRIDRLLDQLRQADDKIKQANDAVDDLKAQADERERASKAALKAARTQADRYRLRASQIAAARPTGDQCVAARDLIVKTLSEDRQ